MLQSIYGLQFRSSRSKRLRTLLCAYRFFTACCGNNSPGSPKAALWRKREELWKEFSRFLACYIKAGKLEVACFRHGKQYGMVEGLRAFVDQPELATGSKSGLVHALQEVFF